MASHNVFTSTWPMLFISDPVAAHPRPPQQELQKPAGLGLEVRGFG